MEKKDIDNSGKQDEELETKGSDERKVSMPKLKTFVALKNPVFRLYFGALLAQRAAFNMHMVTRSLLIYRLTGSAALLGTMSIAFAIPMILTSLFGGAIADRVQKRNMMLIGQASSVVISLGIGISLTMGYLSPEHVGSWWILMAAAATEGAFMGIMLPSRYAIVPEIVGEQSLMNAIALSNLAMNILQLIAPAVAGILIDAFDFHVVYYAMAAMSIIAITFIALMPRTSKTTIAVGSMLANIREGLQYIWHRKTILFILVFVLIVISLARPILVLMPIFTEDILNVGATELGILMSAAGAGAIIGSLTLASLPNKKRGFLLSTGCLVLGMAILGFSLSSSWYLSLAMMVIIGIGHTTRMTLGNALTQYYTEKKYRGRVMSVYSMDFAFTSLGTFAAGLLAETFDVRWVLGGFAVALILIAALVIGFVPRIRNLD